MHGLTSWPLTQTLPTDWCAPRHYQRRRRSVLAADGVCARSHDTHLGKALNAAVAGTGPKIIMATGDSSTGKTRACFEAVMRHPAVSAWQPVHPADAGDYP